MLFPAAIFVSAIDFFVSVDSWLATVYASMPKCDPRQTSLTNGTKIMWRAKHPTDPRAYRPKVGRREVRAHGQALIMGVVRTFVLLRFEKAKEGP